MAQDKKHRLQQLRTIISSMQLENQEDLQHHMAQAGFKVTQATMSRDLKQLRISKVRGRNGRSVYALPREGQFVMLPSQHERDQQRWKVQFSAHLMVIHTPPGHAGMVAYDIDNLAHPYFLGTVAGDDTVLVVMDEKVDRQQALKVIRSVVKHLPEQSNLT